MSYNNYKAKKEKGKKNQVELTRLLGCKSKLLPPHNRIKERRLADIGPPNQRKLRQPVSRAILRLRAALHELRRRDLRVRRVGAEDDVRACQNPSAGRDCGKINIGRDEELLDGDLDFGVVGDQVLRARD